jgi:hypothetical protein
MMSTITEDSDYEKNVYLNIITAKLRYDTVANVSYKVDLTLPKGAWYSGKVTIDF